MAPDATAAASGRGYPYALVDIDGKAILASECSTARASELR
jgi:hypothetical protein